MAKRRKVVPAIIAVVLVIAAVAGLASFRRFNNYKQAIDSISYSGVDIAAVPDGTYTGEYDAYLVRAKVAVTVEAGRIRSIDLLEHYNGRGEAAEGIEQVIVEQQRIDVDTVSGATNSSKVIKKAVDNALAENAQ